MGSPAELLHKGRNLFSFRQSLPLRTLSLLFQINGIIIIIVVVMPEFPVRPKFQLHILVEVQP